MKNASVICFGEILWDVFPSGKEAGGAPMNVAVNLRKLGIDAALISRTGNDDLGAELRDFLKEHKVDAFVQLDAHHTTGVVTVNISADKQVQYDIVFPAAWDFIAFDSEIENAVSTAGYVVFGSLACRNSDTCAALTKVLEKAACKVFDINLRYPHYKRNIVEELLYKADIVKVNEEELTILDRWNGGAGGTAADICERIKKTYTIDQLIVTLGENGAMVSYGSTVFRHPGFNVDVEDTVGSGDAFLAAFLANRIRGRDIKTSLEFACATGAYLATQRGANPQYDESQITKFMIEQTYERNTTKKALSG